MVFRQNLLDSRRVPHAQGKQVCTSAAILATPKFKALSLGHAVKRKNTITKGDAKARLSLPCIGFLEDNRSPEETTEQLGCGLRVFDDCTDECMVDDIKNRFGRERGNGRAKPRIHFKFKFSPFNKHPISVPGIAEAEFLHRLCGDPDSTRLHVDHRCLKVIDLNSYRVHATPTSRHKPERATTLDDRLPQFNRVVADPDHAPSTTDLGLRIFAVLENPQPRQQSQPLASQVIVRNHRSRMKHPPYDRPIAHSGDTEGESGKTARDPWRKRTLVMLIDSCPSISIP